ncbi:hypothetical protein YC2023_005133 [Brassica napus]
MSDGWHDSVAKKDIVNVLVNSPKYSVFMKLKDISEVVKDATLLFKMLYEMVEEIGEAYVVQEKLLEEKGTRLDKRLPTLIIKASTFVHHGAWLEPSRLRTPCGI